MANFSAMGMRPHPHAVRRTRHKCLCRNLENGAAEPL